MIARLQASEALLTRGDNLSREEFLRRWEDCPEIKFAELIGGIVYRPSPVSFDHGDMEGHVGLWLGSFAAVSPGTARGHNSTILIRKDTVQPDVNLRILPEYGGSSWYEGKFLVGAPELLAEIGWSSSAYDLHQKLSIYEAAGVREYLAVLLEEKEIRWHRLVDGKYEVMQPGEDGLLRSHVYPGLWLDGKALLAGDVSALLAALRRGTSSEEHEEFVRRLAATKTSR